MKMPTITELMKELKSQIGSIRYGDSRVINYYLDSPVLAYGIGFCGFVCIFKTKMDLIKAYSYGISHPLKDYSMGGFAEIELNEAINVIKNNKLFARTFIDGQNFENAKTRMEKRYVRPILGSLIATTSYNIEFKYRVVRLANKKLRAELNSWGEKYSKTSLKDFYQLCVNKDNTSELASLNFKDVTGYNVSDKLLAEIKDTLVLEAI